MDPLTAGLLFGSALKMGAPIAADVFSGMSARSGQDKANRTQMDFNAAEAQKQRDFEERMFGSRFQTTRRDLEAAGYNPLLATGMNPGTPAGAAAHAEPKSTTGEMAQIFSTTGKRAAEFSLTGALADKARSEARIAKLDADAHTPTIAKIKAWLGSGLGHLAGGGIAATFLRNLGSAKQFDGVSRRARITR